MKGMLVRGEHRESYYGMICINRRLLYYLTAWHGLQVQDEGKGSEFEVLFINRWSDVLCQPREKSTKISHFNKPSLAFVTLINRLIILLFFFFFFFLLVLQLFSL